MLNPVQFVKAMRNPEALMRQIMGNNQIMSNPMAKNAIEMYQSGDVDGMKQMAENLAKEKGTTIDEVKNNIMSMFNAN